MAKKELRKSISAFSDDPINRRVDQVRRDDDTVKTPKITINDSKKKLRIIKNKFLYIFIILISLYIGIC